MQPFDPRLPRRRYAPRVLALGIAVLTGAIAWKLTGAHPSGANAMIEPAASIALQQAAYAQAERRPGLLAAQALQIRIVPGETLEGAVRRAGIDADQAHSVVAALAAVMDTVHVQAGKTFQAMVAPTSDVRGSARLVGLSMRTGPASTIALSRSFDGALQARKLEEEVRDDTAVSCSQIDSSVGESAAAAGADNALVGRLGQLFSQKLDLSRDIQEGDRLCLVFDRRVSESGRMVGGADLRYAELDAKGGVNRFYAFDRGDGKEPAYYDGEGKSVRGLLLATPIANPR
ncbi:MAG: peptidase, partial [Caulobacteraceae bacterium]|nr:peptidase [Caulobacteraceae bacterium]